MNAAKDEADTRSQPTRKRRRWLLAVGIVIGVLALLACFLVGSVWTSGQKAKAALAARYPPPGQMVDVGGYRLHLHCLGEGSPTVVIEAGMADFSLTWEQVQEGASEITRICTYDRAGLGWSDGSPKPRTAPYAVEELHDLLANARIEPPCVLVGHSLGGLYVRLYAHQYPDQVAGMVLVDSPHEDADSLFPEAFRKANDRFMGQYPSALRVPQALSAIGILARSPEEIPSESLPPLPPGTEDTYRALLSMDSSFFDAAIAEYASFKESGAQMRAAQMGRLGDIPLIVITAGRFEIPESFGLSPEIEDQTRTAWREMQAGLALLSSDGKQVIAEESGHVMQVEQPSVVVAAINEVVQAVRR